MDSSWSFSYEVAVQTRRNQASWVCRFGWKALSLNQEGQRRELDRRLFVLSILRRMQRSRILDHR